MQVQSPNRISRRCASVLFAGFLWASAIPLACAKSTGIQFEQTHVFFGHCQLTVSKEGMRLENKGKLHFTLVAKAPNWRVTIFRHDDKVFFSESLSQFEESGLISGMLVKKENKYILAKNRMSTFDFSGKKLVRLTSKKRIVKYLPLNDLPPQIERILYSAYKVPTNGGIPVFFSHVCSTTDFVTGMRDQGRIEVTLSTDKITDVAANNHIFDPPSDYKAAKSIREVVAGESTRKKDADYEALFDPIK